MTSIKNTGQSTAPTSIDTGDSEHPQTATTSADVAALWVTYVNIILYALCFQFQRPVEPFLIQSLLSEQQQSSNNDTAVDINQTYGNLQSFFSAIQTIGSPLVGILLDRIGIRKASAVVFFASALSYAILASATDLNWLFWSKVPTAFQHAFLVAQATAATATAGNAAARAAALGRMTTAYTIGATLGPALGGYLAGQGDFYIGAKMAVVGSLLSVVLSILYLPDGNDRNSGGSSSSSSRSNHIDAETDPLQLPVAGASSPSKTMVPKRKRSFVEELRHSGEIALRSSLWPLLMVKVLGGLSASMHASTIPLVSVQMLEFDPSQLGLSTSIVMFSVAAFGAAGMAPLTQWLGPPGLAHTGLLARAGLGLVMAALVASSSSYASNQSTVFLQVVAVSVFHALASHALATGLTTQTTGAVQSDEQGALLGLEHSLFALARIPGPSLGTALLRWGGGKSLWPVEFACGGLDVLLVLSVFMTASQTTQKRKSY
jgi:MFS family permease